MGTTNILDLNNRLTRMEKENVAQNSYTSLKNKPKINGVTLTGNKSLADIGAAAAADLIVPEDITITKNTDYVGDAWVNVMKVGKMVVCSGRFEVTTEKPAGQQYSLFTNLPATNTVASICDTGNNNFIISEKGTITSNDKIPVGFYNISVAYISK